MRCNSSRYMSLNALYRRLDLKLLNHKNQRKWGKMILHLRTVLFYFFCCLVSESGRPVRKVNGITRWQTVISAVKVACKHMILDAFHPAL